MKLIYSHKEAVAETLLQVSKQFKHLKRFLDIGCGNGERTMLFNRYNRDVIGMDLRDYRFPECKAFKFIKGDFFKNNLPSEWFDLIYSYDMIEHLEQPDEFLQEIHRLLKDNGILILSTPNKYRITGAILILLGLRKFPYCLAKEHFDEYPEYWHLTEYSTGEIRDIVRKNGFNIKEHHKIFYGMVGRQGLKTLFNLPLFHNHILVLTKTK